MNKYSLIFSLSFSWLVQLPFASAQQSFENSKQTSRAQIPMPDKFGSGFYISPFFNSMTELKSNSEFTTEEFDFKITYKDFKFDMTNAPGLSLGYQFELGNGSILGIGAFIEQEREIRGFSAKADVKIKGTDTTFTGIEAKSSAMTDPPRLSVWGLEGHVQIPYRDIYFPAGGRISLFSLKGNGIESDELKNQFGLSAHLGVGYKFSRNFALQAAGEYTTVSLKFKNMDRAATFSGIGAVGKVQLLF